MEVTNRIFYDVEKSAKRIDDILDASNSNYSDRDSIPARNSLTYDISRNRYGLRQSAYGKSGILRKWT